MDYNYRKQFIRCKTFDDISATTNVTDLKFSYVPECPNEHWNQGKEYFKITVDEDESEVCKY